MWWHSSPWWKYEMAHWWSRVSLSRCSKQKLNTKCSMKADIIGINNFLPKIICANFFWKTRISLNTNNLSQDNLSTTKIQMNGKQSCGQKYCHIDVRYFFIKDRLKSECTQNVYCPTEHMIADFLTKKVFCTLYVPLAHHLHLSSSNELFR